MLHSCNDILLQTVNHCCIRLSEMMFIFVIFSRVLRSVMFITVDRFVVLCKNIKFYVLDLISYLTVLLVSSLIFLNHY